MEFRSLGRSGLKVAPLAFGGNVFGWTADEKTSYALLDRFVERGFNLVDTADVYSKWVPGHTERRIRIDHRPVAETRRRPA